MSNLSYGTRRVISWLFTCAYFCFLWFLMLLVLFGILFISHHESCNNETFSLSKNETRCGIELHATKEESISFSLSDNGYISTFDESITSKSHGHVEITSSDNQIFFSVEKYSNTKKIFFSALNSFLAITGIGAIMIGLVLVLFFWPVRWNYSD